MININIGKNKKIRNLQINSEHYSKIDFLNYCKWTFINILEYADEHQLSLEKIKFRTEADAHAFEKVCSYNNEDSQKWLFDNGYENVFLCSTYKHLFFSLIADFSNYFNASIENAFNGNISVAWALLRKPLQDTLAYLEWLFLDKNELVKLMLESKRASDYELKKDKIKERINIIIAPEVQQVVDMFEFRYSKDDALTLNGIMNASMHLITNRNKSCITSPSGLNFVFTDKKQRENSTGFYYTAIPYVMCYTMDLVMKMFSEIAVLKDYTVLMNTYNLRLKNLKALGTISLEKALELLGIDNNVPIFCPRCGKKMTSLKVWRNFVHSNATCSRCFKKINTFRYIFDFEKIEFRNMNREN